MLLVSHDRYLVNGLASQIWEAQPESTQMTVFKGNYSQLRADQNAKNQTVQETAPQKPGILERTAPPSPRAKKVNQRKLRELEETISILEDELAAVAEKLEHPLDAFEPVAELGKKYVDVQAALDAKWEEWHALFQD